MLSGIDFGLDLAAVIRGLSISVCGCPFKVVVEASVFYCGLDAVDGGQVRLSILSGLLVVEMFDEVVVDEAMESREFRRGVTGYPFENAVTFDNYD